MKDHIQMRIMREKVAALHIMGGNKSSLMEDFDWLTDILRDRIDMFYLTKEEMKRCNKIYKIWKNSPDAKIGA